MRQGTLSGVAAALMLCVSTVGAGPAAPANPWPADGTYHYDILVGGNVLGHSDVTIASDAQSISVKEQMQSGDQQIGTDASYANPGLSLTSYSADFAAAGNAQHTDITVGAGTITVNVPGQSVTIKADPDAPLMIVGDNFVGTMAMLPAILNAARAKAFTLAVLRGGSAAVASVQSEDPSARPADVPTTDAGLIVSVAGIHEHYWYDPNSFVVDDIAVPEQSADFRLTSRK